MKRRTVARLISVVVFGYLFALWVVSNDKSTILHYRSLSQEALLAELTEKNSGSFDGKFAAMLVGVAVIVAIVDGLTWIIELAINRISPLPPVGPLPRTARSTDTGEPPIY